jgi:gliding motility associated protien GldN
MKKVFLACLIGISAITASAQKANLGNGTKPVFDTAGTAPIDAHYKKDNILSAKVTPYANLREADVIFSRRVWREIDLREKQNAIYASPKARLIDILTESITAGELTAYAANPTNDPKQAEFSQVLKPEEAMAKFADSVLVDDFDQQTGEKIGSHIVPGEFNPDSILKFQIKEDWIFDKQRSIWEPRILGIAPMVRVKGNDQPAFWIYFPEARHIFVTKEAISRNNDATGLSFDDMFMKRLFASYIVKESNPEDLRIKDYAQGIDKLYESERIKKSLLDFEHDLWSY